MEGLLDRPDMRVRLLSPDSPHSVLLAGPTPDCSRVEILILAFDLFRPVFCRCEEFLALPLATFGDADFRKLQVRQHVADEAVCDFGEVQLLLVVVLILRQQLEFVERPIADEDSLPSWPLPTPRTFRRVAVRRGNPCHRQVCRVPSSVAGLAAVEICDLCQFALLEME